MQIKEVEKRTGLSAKAIRLYEDKGLLCVRRDESDYRDYTEENIETLLFIKLLRKCGLSIQEIQTSYHDKEKLHVVLYNHIEDINREEFDRNDKKELCLNIIKSDGDYSQLYQSVEFLESDEYKEFMDDLVENENSSLSRQIFLTIVGCGPILSTFLFLLTEQYDERVWIGFLLSLLMSVLMTLSWSSFIKQYRFKNETLGKGIVHFLKMFVLCILTIVFFILGLVFFSFLKRTIYMQESVYILTQSRWITLGFLVVMIQIVVIVFGYISRFMIHRDFKDYEWVLQKITKHKWKIITFNVLLLIFCMINVTTVHTNGMTQYSLFHINGQTYQFSDVEKVETGFYGNGLPFIQTKGDFYYRLIMKDGKVLSFIDCETTSEYEKNTYSELVELDKQVMKHNPIKISDDEYSSYAMLDQEYIDRFISIIHNKSR